MVNAGDNEEEPKSPLDVILEEFNERWFRGWDASPEDQKAKLLSISKAVTEDKDYQELIVGNPDQESVDKLMGKIIDGIIRKKRSGDMSLYREYQQNEGFKENFRNLIVRMVSDTTSMMVLELRKLHHVEDDRDVRNLVFDRIHMDNAISDGDLQVEVMKVFGDRYPGMSQNDWRHIIEDYTSMVREAALPNANEIPMRQYGKAAEPNIED
jgi:type I restriction enzyme R subunit